MRIKTIMVPSLIIGFGLGLASGYADDMSAPGSKKMAVVGNTYDDPWEMNCVADPQTKKLACTVKTAKSGAGPDGARVDFILAEGGAMRCPTWVWKNGTWVQIC